MKRAPDGTRENFGGRSLNEPGRCKRAQIAPISGGQTHFVAPIEPDSHLSCALKSPAQHRRRGHPRKTTYLGSAARWVHKNQPSLLARICAALRSDKHANWSAAPWPVFTMDFFAANYGLRFRAGTMISAHGRHRLRWLSSGLCPGPVQRAARVRMVYVPVRGHDSSHTAATNRSNTNTCCSRRSHTDHSLGRRVRSQVAAWANIRWGHAGSETSPTQADEDDPSTLRCPPAGPRQPPPYGRPDPRGSLA